MGEAKRRRVAGVPLPPGLPSRLRAHTRATVGPALAEAALGLFDAEWRTAGNILAEPGAPPAKVLEVIGNANGWAQKLAQEAQARRATPLACRAGCAWCCMVPVTVAAPEVLLIVAWMRERLSSEQIAAVRARVAQEEANARLPIAARTPRPCPLLEDARCQAYAVRPGACIGYTSTDARVCQRYAETGDPTLTTRADAFSREVAGRVPALAAEALASLAGAPRSEPLDLILALRIALEHPDPLAAWLAGEPLFVSACRPAEDLAVMAARNARSEAPR